jgi:hypothetical protein
MVRRAAVENAAAVLVPCRIQTHGYLMQRHMLLVRLSSVAT